MITTSSYIVLKGVRFYSFHGVMSQESRVGAHFIVNLRVGYPVEKAMQSDNVGDTLDYAALFNLVRREMDIPSKLLEHVAGRIVKAIHEQFPQVSSIHLRITKKNPPMGADSKGAGVEVNVKM